MTTKISELEVGQKLIVETGYSGTVLEIFDQRVFVKDRKYYEIEVKRVLTAQIELK